MIQPEELVGEEWGAWYRLSPVERWTESERLWQIYLQLGGSLEPEPDTQSPCVFYGAAEFDRDTDLAIYPVPKISRTL